MGLFGATKQVEPDMRLDELMDELRAVAKSIAELKGEREATIDLQELEQEYATTKKELTDLTIEFELEKERHDREIRETEHLVGLQKKRGEFERKAAEREARLAVREENLTETQKRLEQQVEFIQAQFDKSFGSLNSLMEKFLERMPTTKQLITTGARNGSVDD